MMTFTFSLVLTAHIRITALKHCVSILAVPAIVMLYNFNDAKSPEHTYPNTCFILLSMARLAWLLFFYNREIIKS